MSFIGDIFNILLYQPLLNVLILLYKYLPGQDFGVAVVVLTLLIRVILHPLAVKGIKSQRALQEIQPKIKAIQEQSKNDKERQARETLALYKKEKINPFSGFLTVLVQLPILIALFRVFGGDFSKSYQFLYGFVSSPAELNTVFLGMVNLAEASAALAVLTGIAQFVQAKMTSPSIGKSVPAQSRDFSAMMQKQMLYFLPAFTVFILWKLPSALALYWLVTTLFTIVQQYFIFKKYDKDGVRTS